MTPARRPRAAFAFVFALLAIGFFGSAQGLDSCCAKAAAAAGGTPAVEWVPNYTATQPDGWDEEEDGPWERPLMPKPPPGAREVFFLEMRNSLSDSSPWLLIGLLSSGVLQAFRPSQASVRRHLAGEGLLSVTKGALGGLLSPLCSCATLPLGLGLQDAGASPPAIVAFLVAAQAAGVDSLMFTVGVLGPRAAAARLVVAAAIAVWAGAVTPATPAARRRPESDIGKGCAQSGPALVALPWKVVEVAVESLEEVLPAVVLGFAAAAAVVAFLPAGGLAAVGTLLGGAKGRAAVLLVALPLQFCEHAAVPLAAALQSAGAGGGLAFAMLATMPAVNAACLGVIARLAGAGGAVRVAAALWLAGFAGSFAADGLGLGVVPVGHGEGLLPEWYEKASPWVLGALVVGAVLRRLQRRSGAHCCGEEKSCKAE